MQYPPPRHSSSELGSILHIHHIQAFCNYKNLQLISSSNGEWLDLEPDRGESKVEEGEREPAEEENGDHGDQKFARSKIAVAIYIVIVIVIFRVETFCIF